MTDTAQAMEGVGANYDFAMMMEARARTWRAIGEIADAIAPGMSEAEGLALTRRVLKDAELLRGWHGAWIRFGENTLKPFGEQAEPGPVLQENDIFFLDLGPVWRKWEADAGATFVVGSDPDMHAARRDVRAIFDSVQAHWIATGATGRDLYAFAEAEAARLGWTLNLDLSGHRLADFPHSAHYKGALADIGFRPAPDLWVLEIHIRHPERPFGAFFEDMLRAPA